jgi:hypothetical protein
MAFYAQCMSHIVVIAFLAHTKCVGDIEHSEICCITVAALIRTSAPCAGVGTFLASAIRSIGIVACLTYALPRF